MTFGAKSKKLLDFWCEKVNSKEEKSEILILIKKKCLEKTQKNYQKKKS